LEFTEVAMDIAAWLRDLGLEQYEAAFRDNAVDFEILPELTESDLAALGVLLGDRKRILRAIRLETSNKGRAATLIPDPERRHLTVLFCDLVGSTALSARLEPEDLREIVATYCDLVSDTIRRHGGYVGRYGGDSVLAYFGWPEAHEDDAERAVRTGLAAVKAVSELDVVNAGPLAARVGIATGPVVIGHIVGEGIGQEHGVVGETPNLAARLQTLAESGDVVVCPTTRRMTGNLFAWSDLGKIALKGIPERIRVFRTLSELRIESRFKALRGSAIAGSSNTASLVGRDQELQLLLKLWTRATCGEGQIVLLGGEPGIGKSRLAATLSEMLQDRPSRRLEWFCSPHYQDSALYPVISRLMHVVGFTQDDLPDVRLQKLVALLAPTNPAAEEIALVADLLGLSAGDRYPMPELSPQRRRERTLMALLDRFEALARSGPLFAVLEDAHWADPSTRELLELAISRIAKPDFHSLAEKAQIYQHSSFLGTTPCGAGRGSLNRSVSENRSIALIFGVWGREMPFSALNASTSWLSRSR